MGTAKVILFYEKCRLCLNELGVHNICETQELARDIFSCTGVKVTPSDNLPQKICSNCAEIVASAKELRLVAMNNDSILRSLFDDGSNGLMNQCTSKIEDELSTSVINNTVISSDNCKSVNKRNSEHSSTVSKGSSSAKEPIEEKTGSENKKKIRETENKCETCRKHFETPKKLHIHQRQHIRNLACPLDACGKRFATKGDLEKHVRTHTGVKPYSCDICDKCFTQKGTLKTHRETVHYIFKISNK